MPGRWLASPWAFAHAIISCPPLTLWLSTLLLQGGDTNTGYGGGGGGDTGFGGGRSSDQNPDSYGSNDGQARAQLSALQSIDLFCHLLTS